MDGTPILNAPWPYDIDPATVPFSERSMTFLRRVGFFGDWTLFHALTEGRGDHSAPGYISRHLVDLRRRSPESGGLGGLASKLERALRGR